MAKIVPLLFLFLFLVSTALSASCSYSVAAENVPLQTLIDDKVAASCNPLILTLDNAETYSTTTPSVISVSMNVPSIELVLTPGGTNTDFSLVTFQFNGFAKVSLKNFKIANPDNPLFSDCETSIDSSFFKKKGIVSTSLIVSLTNTQFIDVVDTFAAVFASNADLSITNCQFQGTTGTAVMGKHMTVSTSTFTDNKSSSTPGGAIHSLGNLLLTSNTFTSNEGISGGALFSQGSITATGNNFNGNKATSQIAPDGSGGAIYTYGSVSLTGNTFNANSAKLKGGAIGVENNGANPVITINAGNAFTSNIAVQGGGAIFSRNSVVVTSSDNDFDDNDTIMQGTGGAIHALGGVNAKGRFKRNKSQGGGAIYCESSCAVSDATFEKNYSPYRGGAVTSYNADLTISGVTNWTGNIAGVSGGCVYSRVGRTISVSGTYLFKDNKGLTTETGVDQDPPEGGCLVAREGTVTVTGTGSFEGNSAPNTQGGAILAFHVTATGTTFKSNSAKYGGAVYAYRSVTLTDNTFIGNSATSFGHAIRTGATGVDSTVTTSTFSNNKGTGKGGIYLSDGKLTLDGTLSDTDIFLLSPGSTLIKGGTGAQVECADPSDFVFGPDGNLRCTDSDSQLRMRFSVENQNSKSLAQLKEAVVSTACACTVNENSYDDLASRTSVSLLSGNVASTKRAPKLDVEVVIFGAAVAQLNQYATNLGSGLGSDFPGTVVQGTFPDQDPSSNECFKIDTNACNTNGYCVRGDANYGYCSCMSGFKGRQCQLGASGIVRDAVLTDDAKLDGNLKLALLSSSATFTVVLPSSKTSKDADPNFATKTLLSFRNGLDSCDYPKSTSWALRSYNDAGKWFDEYEATISYTDLVTCGLSKTADAGDWIVFKNSLFVERDFTVQSGRFVMNRVGKLDIPFQVKFPKKVSSTSSMSAASNVVDVFGTTTDLEFNSQTTVWTLQFSSIVSNNYKLLRPNVVGNPFTPGPNRDFTLLAGDGNPTRNNNQEVTQTFTFTFSACAAANFADFKIYFPVACFDTTCPTPSTDPVEMKLSVHTQDACPVSQNFVLTTLSMVSYKDLALSQLNSNFVGTDTVYFGIKFDVPVALDTTSPSATFPVTVVSVCSYATAQASPPPCSSSLTLSQHLSNSGGFKAGFSVNAGDLKTASGATGSSSFVVQADITVAYGDNVQKKRSVTFEKGQSGWTVLSVSDHDEHPEQKRNRFDASASSIVSVSVGIIAILSLLLL